MTMETTINIHIYIYTYILWFVCNLSTLMFALMWLHVNLAHHQHVPMAHMAQVPVEGGPWFLGVGHHTVAWAISLGGKSRCAAADFIWRRQGSFYIILVVGPLSFLTIRDCWDLGLPVGRGEIPFTLVAELPGAPATLQFWLAGFGISPFFSL